ncbi:hypothetical protein MLD38_037292 [Melastoma candidum]|uniref:Uncharacterized protein n=1 Tax=Melastoma candidum TaxID=119954 RepID=A0ACB9LML7_9MYRT|nr:hypothetical protein MLD38_037292 [Melastoma candidum]
MGEERNYRKYGVPLYCAAYVPSRLLLLQQRAEEEPAEGGDRDKVDEELVHGLETDRDYVLLAGGGGEGRNGIPNAVLLAAFEYADNSLSPEPVYRLGTGSDSPYRMAVHPNEDGFVCAFPNGCRFFEWDNIKGKDSHDYGLKTSDKVLKELENVGQQLALAFNHDGSVLAAGGEDGKLRIFKWPSMDIILDEDQAHSSVKDLDFSLDGKFIVSLGDSGPCRIWDVASCASVASLAKEAGERFGYCRFSTNIDGSNILYTTAMAGGGGSIITWDASSWKRMSTKQLVRDSINAFNVSSDGKLLAIGTGDGDILIVNSANMKAEMTIKKAHLGFVTALSFSPDSRAVVSVSMDSSARVTQIHYKKPGGGMNSWFVIILIIIVAIAFYSVQQQGLLL